MPNRIPTVFLSSTFYDLRQVRADVSQFVEQQLGYRFLASEHPSFPVDASLSTIENCRQQVESEADILVLIVGSRYGTVPPNASRSVTNIEYATARAKGIPIFAFVSRDVVALLPTFERNPESDFSGSVDSPKLLQFVRELRGVDGVWVFTFDLAQEIIATVRVQLAYAMARGLSLSVSRSEEPALRSLSGPAFRILIERPVPWEPRLFVQVLEDEFTAVRGFRREYDLGIAMGPGERIPHEVMTEWIASMASEAKRLIEAIEAVAAAALSNAFATGEALPIVEGARQMALVYREALSFVARIRRAYIPDEWREVRQEVAALFSSFFAECDACLPRFKNQIKEAVNDPSPGPIYIRFAFTFEITNTHRLLELQRQLLRKQGSLAE